MAQGGEVSRGLYLRGKPPNGIWWLSISVGGQRFRGSTGIRGGKPGKPPREAEMFKAQKLTELGRGNLAAMDSDRVTIADLIRAQLDRYKAEGRASYENVKDRTRFLIEWYGPVRAIHFTPDMGTAYALRRKEMDAAVATINSEIAYLRRAFSMAIEDRRLYYAPKLRRLPGANKRFGTIDDETLERIVGKLRPELRGVVEFLRLTGWRRNEALGLEWWRVDFQGEQVRLETSKTGRPRALPWTTYPSLGDLLRRQRASADRVQMRRGIIVARVFHREHDGGPITANALCNAWMRACDTVGAFGPPKADGSRSRPMIHDLRRTLNSEMDRRGVPWSVQKAVTGHESDRQHGDYVIAPRRDVEDGLKKLAEAQPEQSVVGYFRRPRETS